MKALVASERLELAADREIQQFRLDSTDRVLDHAVSRGGYGEVWRGRYRQQTEVAVKLLLFGKRRQLDHMRKFADEIKIMATLDHPRIVRFVGVCWSAVLPLSAVMACTACSTASDHR